MCLLHETWTKWRIRVTLICSSPPPWCKYSRRTSLLSGRRFHIWGGLALSLRLKFLVFCPSTTALQLRSWTGAGLRGAQACRLSFPHPKLFWRSLGLLASAPRGAGGQAFCTQFAQIRQYERGTNGNKRKQAKLAAHFRASPPSLRNVFPGPRSLVSGTPRDTRQISRPLSLTHGLSPRFPVDRHKHDEEREEQQKTLSRRARVWGCSAGAKKQWSDSLGTV